jgi:hypothetical protein
LPLEIQASNILAEIKPPAVRISALTGQIGPLGNTAVHSTPVVRILLIHPRHGITLPFKRGTQRMQNPDKLDYAKLLGFAQVSDRISASIDFQDETFSARLGAKVGKPEFGPATDKK